MNRDFVFEDDADGQPTSKAQSPWEFSKYTAGAEEEHSRRSTTSVDQKISQLQQRKNSRAEALRQTESDSSEIEFDEQAKQQSADDSDDAVEYQQLDKRNSDSEDFSEEDAEDGDSEQDVDEFENRRPEKTSDRSETASVQRTKVPWP